MKIKGILEKNREIITNVTFIFLIPLIIFNFLGLLNIQNFVSEILSSLRFQYTASAIIFLAITFLAFNYKSKVFYANIILSLLIIGLNINSIVPLYLTKTFPKDKGHIKVLLSNVLKSNKDKKNVLEIFKKENPDIIVTLEVDKEWEKTLHKLDKIYPYSYFSTRLDCFGIAIQSKFPLTHTETISLTGFYIPSIKAKFITEGKPVTIIATHPLPPKNSKQIILRNEQIEEISKIIKEEKGRVILAGDLNTTMFSSVYKSLIKESGLTDSRNGFGFLPTFPQGASIFVKVPIDYILYKGFNTYKTYTIEVTGSDHNGIVSILNLNPAH